MCKNRENHDFHAGIKQICVKDLPLLTDHRENQAGVISTTKKSPEELTHFWIRTIEVNIQMGKKTCFFHRGDSWSLYQTDVTCMATDKNYCAMLLATYNVQNWGTSSHRIRIR